MRQPRAGRRGLFSFCICIILAFMGAVIHGQTTRPEQPPATQPAGPKFQDTRDRIAEVVAGVVTRTHGEKSWHQAPAVQADLNIQMNDASPLTCTITCETQGHRVRVDLKDGPFIVFDGDRTSTEPAGTISEAVQAQLLVCARMFEAPFTLGERGSQPQAYRMRPFQGEPSDVFTLTSTEKSCIKLGEWAVHANARTHLLHAVAFSWPKKGDDSPLAARCIVFQNYGTIHGVTLATKWSIFEWGGSDIEGDPIGTAAVSNVRFISPPKDYFRQPADPAAAPSTRPAP